jgi:hypothetical protein
MVTKGRKISQSTLRQLVDGKLLKSCSDISHRGARRDRTLWNRHLNYIKLWHESLVVLTHRRGSASSADYVGHQAHTGD